MLGIMRIHSEQQCVVQIRSFLAATILMLSYLKRHHFLGCLVHPYCRGLQELWAEKLEVTCCWFQLWILILPVNSKFTTREQRKPTCWLEVMGATWVVSITLFCSWAIKSLLTLGTHVQWGLQYSIWVCVCVCLCLSVTMLDATSFNYTFQVRYERLIFSRFQVVNFAKNILFKSYGIICLLRRPQAISVHSRNIDKEFFTRLNHE